MDWQGLRFLGESPIDGYVLQNCTYSPSLVALAFPLRPPRRVHGTGHGRAGRQQPEPPAPLAMDRAFCLGSGIWATHFVAMLAFHAPIALRYDLPITGLSLLIAVAASYLAMYMTARPRFGLLPCLLAACCIGLGIAAMHYTGMAAMRSVATQYYQPSLFALSVLIAIGAAFTARRGPLPARPAQRALPLHETDRQPAAGRRHRRHAFHRDGRAGAQRTRRHAAGTASQRRLAAPGLAHGVLASAIAACGIWAAWSEKQRERRLSENSRVNALLNQLDHAHALAAPDGSLRQPDRPAEPHGIQRSVRPAPGELSPERQGPGGDVPRPRSLQADQRLPRPRLWRPTAEDRLRTHPQRVAR